MRQFFHVWVAPRFLHWLKNWLAANYDIRVATSDLVGYSTAWACCAREDQRNTCLWLSLPCQVFQQQQQQQHQQQQQQQQKQKKKQKQSQKQKHKHKQKQKQKAGAVAVAAIATRISQVPRNRQSLPLGRQIVHCLFALTQEETNKMTSEQLKERKWLGADGIYSCRPCEVLSILCSVALGLELPFTHEEFQIGESTKSICGVAKTVGCNTRNHIRKLVPMREDNLYGDNSQSTVDSLSGQARA